MRCFYLKLQAANTGSYSVIEAPTTMPGHITHYDDTMHRPRFIPPFFQGGQRFSNETLLGEGLDMNQE